MQTSTKHNHQKGNFYDALGVSKVRLKTILYHHDTGRTHFTNKSEAFAHVISICQTPEELAIACYLIGRRDVCNECPIGMLTDLIKDQS